MRRIATLFTALLATVGLLQTAAIAPHVATPVRAAQTVAQSAVADADVQTSTIGATARALQRVMWQLPHQWEFAQASQPPIATADNDIVEIHDITVVLSHDPNGDRERTPQDPAVVRAAFSKAQQYIAQQTDGRITLRLRRILTYESPTHGCANAKGFAKDLGSATGVWQSEFHHIVAWFPNERCALEGEAVLQAKRGQPYRVMGNIAWVGHRAFPEDVFTHEALHLIGLFHAQSLSCARNASGKRLSRQAYEGCKFEEYGDPFDVMGYDQSRSVSELPQVSPAGMYFLGFRRDQFYRVQQRAGHVPGPVFLKPSHIPSDRRYLHLITENNEHYLMTYVTPGGSDWPLARAAGGPGLAVYRLQDRPGHANEPTSITGMALLDTAKGVGAQSMLVREGQSLRLFGSDLTVRWERSGNGAQVQLRSSSAVPRKESRLVKVTPPVDSHDDGTVQRPSKSSSQIPVTPKP